MITDKYQELKQRFPKPYSFRCEECGAKVMGEIRISLFPDRIDFYRPKLCSKCDNTIDGDGWFQTRKMFELKDTTAPE